MCVVNAIEYDLSIIDFLLQRRRHPASSVSVLTGTLCRHHEYLLIWIRGVDNDGFLGIVVNYEIGIVVTTALPYVKSAAKLCDWLRVGSK